MSGRAAYLERRKELAATGFFRLWAAETVSLTGAQITQFALPLIAVITLAATPMEMGVLVAAGSAASLVLGLSVGVWADRYERVALMHIANLGRLLMLLTVPVLYWMDALSIGLLASASFVVGALTLLFDAAMVPYVARVVGRRLLTPANSWVQGSIAMGDVAGPGLASLMVQWLGAPVTLLIEAFGYVLSSASLSRLPKHRPESAREEKEDHWKAVKTGFQVLRDDRIMRPLVLAATHFNFFQAAFLTVWIMYAVRDLGFSPILLGGLTMLGGIAGLTAASFGTRLFTRFGIGPVMIFAYTIPGVTGVVLGVAHLMDRPMSMAVAAVTQFSWIFGVVLVLTAGASVRQALVPDHQLGRVTATVRFISWGMEPVGALASGMIATTVLGLSGTVVLSSAGVATAALWLLFSPVRLLRDLPDEPAPEPDAQAIREPVPDGVAEG